MALQCSMGRFEDLLNPPRILWHFARLCTPAGRPTLRAFIVWVFPTMKTQSRHLSTIFALVMGFNPAGAATEPFSLTFCERAGTDLTFDPNHFYVVAGEVHANVRSIPGIGFLIQMAGKSVQEEGTGSRTRTGGLSSPHGTAIFPDPGQ